MTRRLCFACDLVDEVAAIAAYRRWHAPSAQPPGVLKRLRERGVVDLEIWLTGNRLMMIMTVDDRFSNEGSSDDRTHPEDAAWEAQMDAFQRPLPWANGSKWTPMERIFTLD
jgi:L-rhamnose mutarotase